MGYYLLATAYANDFPYLRVSANTHGKRHFNDIILPEIRQLLNIKTGRLPKDPKEPLVATPIFNQIGISYYQDDKSSLREIMIEVNETTILGGELGRAGGDYLKNAFDTERTCVWDYFFFDGLGDMAHSTSCETVFFLDHLMGCKNMNHCMNCGRQIVEILGDRVVKNVNLEGIYGNR